MPTDRQLAAIVALFCGLLTIIRIRLNASRSTIDEFRWESKVSWGLYSTYFINKVIKAVPLGLNLMLCSGLFTLNSSLVPESLNSVTSVRFSGFSTDNTL